jgi:hypothetical protein
MVSKSLDTLFGPFLHTLQELTLMLVMEFLDTSLKLYLSGTQRVYLLELLQVEESFRD